MAEFQALAKELRTQLAELTERVIREAIHDDVTEAAEADVKGAPAVDMSETMPR